MKEKKENTTLDENPNQLKDDISTGNSETELLDLIVDILIKKILEDE